MSSNRTVLELHTLGERTLPSGVVPTPVPFGSVVIAHSSHPLHGLGNAAYTGPAISIDAGAGFALTGAANLGALGQFHMKGAIQGVGLVESGRAMGEITLTNAHGTITLALHGRVQPAFSPIPVELVYSLTGGTGDFQHVTGYGSVGVKLEPAPIAFGQPPSGRIELSCS